MSEQESPPQSRAHLTQRRQESSTPRRRATDPPIRRRKDDRRKPRVGVIALVAAISALAIAYAYNFGGTRAIITGIIPGLVPAGQSNNAEAISLAMTAIPLLLLLVVAIGGFLLLRAGVRSTRRLNKKRKFAGREVITLEHFRYITAARGIRPRVSTYAYKLLLPHYQRHMRVRLEDRLHEDLQLSDRQIAEMLMKLLRNTDRKPAMGATPVLISVLDLLQTVQDAPHAFFQESGGPVAAPDAPSGFRRVSDETAPVPPQVPSQPEPTIRQEL